MNQREANMSKLAVEVDDLFDKSVDMAVNDEDKHVIQNAQNIWKQYLDANKQLIQISRKFDSDANIAFLNQSISYYSSTEEPLYLSINDAILAETVNVTKVSNALYEEANILTDNTIRNTQILAFLAFLLSVAIIVFFETTVLQLLIRLTDLMNRLALGNNIEIEGQERTDELGAMAKALAVFKNNALEKIRLEEERQKAEILNKQEKEQAKQKLAKDFETSVQSIITMVASASTELSYTAENMQKSISNVNQESTSVSSSSLQTSSNVVAVAAAVEEMSASIKEVSGQVSKTSTLMTDAVAKTTEANTSVKQLTTAVTEISNILEMIDNIAKQINLLALNATIESARAGEAGKGFAVVASEIKTLADQTAKATDTISGQIENIEKVSGSVALALGNIQDSIGNVNKYAIGIASAVEEQAIATNEISANMHNASKGVQNITNSINGISKGASEADSAAKEVLSASQMLSKQSETLNMQVKVFLDGIKAS